MLPLPFSGITTFARSTHVPVNECGGVLAGDKPRIAVLGVPYDSATSSRSGARFGPRGIREASLLLWGYNNVQKVAPFEKLDVFDAGDADVVPVDIRATYASIEMATSTILSGGYRQLTLGGDHSILLPLLRAHAKKYGPLAVVHFDAHPDTWDLEYENQPYSHGTPCRRAIEEGLIDVEAYFQIGIRGPTGGPEDYQDALKLGARMVTYEEYRRLGAKNLLPEIHACVGPRPLYVTFDIDAVDPAYAPATGTPEVGGLTSYEAIELVRGLKGLNMVGCDIVEVAPPFDHAGITSILAANLGFEFLSLWAMQPGR